MTAKKNRGRAVKMKTEYTSEEGNKNTVRNATKEERKMLYWKEREKHDLGLFIQAICFAKITRSSKH